MGSSPWGHRESDATERLTFPLFGTLAGPQTHCWVGGLWGPREYPLPPIRQGPHMQGYLRLPGGEAPGQRQPGRWSDPVKPGFRAYLGGVTVPAGDLPADTAQGTGGSVPVRGADCSCHTGSSPARRPPPLARAHAGPDPNS